MRNGPCLCGDPECRRCFPNVGEDEEEDLRERDGDDGSSYGDPRDEMDERLRRD